MLDGLLANFGLFEGTGKVVVFAGNFVDEEQKAAEFPSDGRGG